MKLAAFVLFLIFHVPGQKQPAVHREDMDTLDECIGMAMVLLKKAEEKGQLLQAGCIHIPIPTQEGTR